MEWQFEKLKRYLKSLKSNQQLPHNLLLKTNQIDLGNQLLISLTTDSSLQNDCFVFRYHADFEKQKQQLSELFFWTNLAKKTTNYVFFYLPELEKYSYLFYNRLLKLLEDHKTHLVGILQTTKTHSLPQTIISRCQLFQIKPVSTTPFHQIDIHITRFFHLLNQKALWKSFFSLYDETQISAFWPWFQTLLIAFQTRLRTRSFSDQFESNLFHSGWKLLINNLWAEQKYNFSLDAKTTWILFVSQVRIFHENKAKQSFQFN